jgi:hypothetical protein
MYIDKPSSTFGAIEVGGVPKFFQAPIPCALHILETFVLRINFQLYKYVC